MATNRTHEIKLVGGPRDGEDLPATREMFYGPTLCIARLNPATMRDYKDHPSPVVESNTLVDVYHATRFDGVFRFDHTE